MFTCRSRLFLLPPIHKEHNDAEKQQYKTSCWNNNSYYVEYDALACTIKKKDNFGCCITTPAVEQGNRRIILIQRGLAQLGIDVSSAIEHAIDFIRAFTMTRVGETSHGRCTKIVKDLVEVLLIYALLCVITIFGTTGGEIFGLGVCNNSFQQ
ncbi:uncharacterized protein [Spinacia oleracea]|uniref:Uncharacterized protein isoform X2 n=1 Tax=Spinacia oleracea TaxID=3562 RepID=A0ABM3QTC7_SPIOL|nr:uncharacterized protein LOC130462436 isoform X2 [Spinacia oleracea]